MHDILVIELIYRSPDDSYAIVSVNGKLCTYWRDEERVSLFTKDYGWESVSAPVSERHQAVHDQLWMRLHRGRLEYSAE